MAGFLSGLFKGKQSAEMTEVKEAVKKEPKPEVKQPKPQAVPARQASAKAGAYFLDADQAKTYGDIDYMRTAKAVRRTFPKTASQPEEKEFVQTVSAMSAATQGKPGEFVSPLTQAALEKITDQPSTEASFASAPQPVTQRRKADSSMNMFRNMAKEIRK